MSLADVDDAQLAKIREIVAEILEVEPEEITWESNFQDDHGADSLRGIEVLAALERHYGITIDQALLPQFVDLSRTYQVVADALRDQRLA